MTGTLTVDSSGELYVAIYNGKTEILEYAAGAEKPEVTFVEPVGHVGGLALSSH
jgi:hypothetical protein